MFSPIKPPTQSGAASSGNPSQSQPSSLSWADVIETINKTVDINKVCILPAGYKLIVKGQEITLPQPLYYAGSDLGWCIVNPDAQEIGKNSDDEEIRHYIELYYCAHLTGEIAKLPFALLTERRFFTCKAKITVLTKPTLPSSATEEDKAQAQEEYTAACKQAFETAQKEGEITEVITGSPTDLMQLDTPGNTQFILILPCVDGIDLFSYFNLDEKNPDGTPNLLDTITTILSFFRAINELHARKITYGDVKPENGILTPTGEVKVIDCEFAEKGNCLPSNRGSLRFAAPEIFLTPHGETVGWDVDNYALGVTLSIACGIRSVWSIREHALSNIIYLSNKDRKCFDDFVAGKIKLNPDQVEQLKSQIKQLEELRQYYLLYFTQDYFNNRFEPIKENARLLNNLTTQLIKSRWPIEETPLEFHREFRSHFQLELQSIQNDDPARYESKVEAYKDAMMKIKELVMGLTARQTLEKPRMSIAEAIAKLESLYHSLHQSDEKSSESEEEQEDNASVVSGENDDAYDAFDGDVSEGDDGEAELEAIDTARQGSQPTSVPVISPQPMRPNSTKPWCLGVAALPQLGVFNGAQTQVRRPPVGRSISCPSLGVSSAVSDLPPTTGAILAQ